MENVDLHTPKIMKKSCLVILCILSFVSCERDETPSKEMRLPLEGEEIAKSFSMISIRPFPSAGVEMILASKDEDYFEIVDTHRNFKIKKNQFSDFLRKQSQNSYKTNEKSKFFVIDLYSENGVERSIKVGRGSQCGEHIFWLFYDVFGGIVTDMLNEPSDFSARSNVFFNVVR